MKPRFLLLSCLVEIVLGCAGSVAAAEPVRMMDLQVGSQQYQGRIVTHTVESCWIFEPNGRMQKFSVDRVKQFNVMPDPFRSASAQELKIQLQEKLGKSYEVRTSSHYVVASVRGRAEAHSAVFERIYREFFRSFRSRGIELSEPEFPLVAVIHPDQSGFIRSLQAEKVAFRPNLLGCYFLTSNQVIVYERSATHEVDQTLIHEAMHQIAFNTGLHSRIRPQPKWVIEGLALVYEADGIRNRQGTKVGDRINPERYRWFNDYLRSRRTARSLAQFLKSDDLFVTQTLDAYSEAWAFSFFLLETRSDKYVHYLKMLARSDMAASNADDDRLANFTNVFGDDLDQLEADYLRFLKRVAPQ